MKQLQSVFSKFKGYSPEICCVAKWFWGQLVWLFVSFLRMLFLAATLWWSVHIDAYM